VGKKWRSDERRAEIMRILESRRHETMANLAFQFDVSIRTINYDIEILTASYPIETVRGNGGCVKLKEGYRLYQHNLSEIQQKTLIDIIPLISRQQAEVIKGLLIAHGSKENAGIIDGLII
jgi:predicted DNA-binding transcriptional regulator YafY